jgi:hypothetical protein
VTKYRQKDNEAVIKVTNDIEVRTTLPTKRYIKCWQFKIDAHNAEKAEEFVRDITFSFIKNAANRQADDAGRILYIISYLILALEGAGAAGGKKGGKKKGGK